MDFPLIANSGPKGPAVVELLRRVPGSAVFIDDIPHNHASVARLAPAVHRLHYVADTRLAALPGPAADCHPRPPPLVEIQEHVSALLSRGVATRVTAFTTRGTHRRTACRK